MGKSLTGRSIVLIALIFQCFFPTAQTIGASRKGRGNSGALPDGMYFKTGSLAIDIDTNTKYQTIDGFGIFGAMDTWWGNPQGMYSDRWANQVLDDLGITIWRNEYYPPATAKSPQDADWSKQLPVVKGLVKKARDKGIDLKIILTVWSPPESMKCAISADGKSVINGQPSAQGTKGGGALCTNKYANFAQWLIDGIKMYKDIGVDVYAISPQNEPLGAVPYNSCVYTQAWYVEMLKIVGPRLKAVYPKVKIFGAEYMLEDEGGDHRQWFLNRAISNSPEALRNFDIFAMHRYFGGSVPPSTSTEAKLWSNSKTDYIDHVGRPIWMTETAGFVDSWEETGKSGALDLALAIHAALSSGHASGWVWWQGSELSGISKYNLMKGVEQRSKRYYVSKNFYHFIRPGARMVKVQADKGSGIFASAYLRQGTRTLTTVLINTSSQGKTIRLDGANVPHSFNLYETTAKEDCLAKGTVSRESVFLPAKSVVTLVGRTTLAKHSTAIYK